MTGVSGPSGAERSTTRTDPESSAAARSASDWLELMCVLRCRALDRQRGGSPVGAKKPSLPRKYEFATITEGGRLIVGLTVLRSVSFSGRLGYIASLPGRIGQHRDEWICMQEGAA